ncbi:RidA family protein [Arthrobacter sp. NPDC056886]|uniref:RidA family protein n=1 Tax=Arthrobacter sp. NPDC056886 TaxID=3345960 RepID=UPI0036711637
MLSSQPQSENLMQHHVSPDVPLPGGPYSHAVSASGLVYLSGQRPQHPVTGAIPDGVVAQARQVFENLGSVLKSCGCTFADVIKVSVYLADIADFAAFNEVYREFLVEPYPARTTIACTLRGIQVEVDLVAALATSIPSAG